MEKSEVRKQLPEPAPRRGREFGKLHTRAPALRSIRPARKARREQLRLPGGCRAITRDDRAFARQREKDRQARQWRDAAWRTMLLFGFGLIRGGQCLPYAVFALTWPVKRGMTAAYRHGSREQL